MPATIQKSLGMADIDESALTEAATLLQVWFAGSREVIASFHSAEQGLPQASALLSGKVSEANTSGFQRDGRVRCK